MKKITLLLLLSLSAVSLQAQNFYNLSTLQQPYADLEGSTSINNNQVWDFNTFQTITLPFNFSITGQPVNRFLFEDDYFAFITPTGDFEEGDGVFYFYPTSAYIQDRTNSTNVSSSPISYKTDGETGNRIFKVEIKNAGLEDAASLGFTEDHFFVNYQIWFYEADNSIEFRYGSNNITDINYVSNEDEGLLAGFEGEIKSYIMYGPSTSPIYNEFGEETDPNESFTLNAFPANGTVYRLAPAQVAGLDDFSAAAVKLYPNPVSSVLHLQGDNLTASEYAIYNVAGKLVAQNKISDSNDIRINVENLQQGLYLIKINNQYLKFIRN